MIGVILSSKFVSSTLRAQFGEITPIELPVQNKTLLSHQLESLEVMCNDIYITTPISYSIDVSSEIRRIELDPSLSLIEVLRIISNKFNLTERVFIYFGDSLFLKLGQLDDSKNYFFVQKPKHQYVWGFSSEVGYVPAGGIIISIVELRSALLSCGDFDKLSKKLMQSSDIELFSDFDWLDFGHALTFYDSRKRFLESRSFNRLAQNGGFIVKSSNDFLKLWSEYCWLKVAKEKLPLNIPYVSSFDIKRMMAHYSIEYINHPTLSDIFVFGKISQYFFLKILESVERTLKKLRSFDFKKSELIEDDFLSRKLAVRSAEIISITDELNGNLDFVRRRIDENIAYFSKRKYEIVPIHGDLCFSNILFDFSTFEPVLIDPRGYISENVGFSMYGPGIYDYYKLAQSYIIGYDFLIAGKEDEIFFSNTEILRRLNIFCELFQLHKDDLKMGLINLFLTMLPLHSDSPSRQKSFLNALFIIHEL